MAEPKKQEEHKLQIVNRETMEVSGVLNVNKFTDEDVILDTELGVLNVKGEKMHMRKLNLDEGELAIEGFIKNLTYSESADYKERGKGLINRLFK
jgi:sporulation protein YabP